MRNPIETYSHFVSYHTKIVLAIVILATILLSIGSSFVGTKYMETRDIIPENLEVIQAFELLESNFGSDTTIMIAIELDPEYQGSDEIRDVRDPRVLKYMNLLTELAESNSRVAIASSGASILKDMNGGVLPQSEREINKLFMNNPLLDMYIGSKYEIAVIRMSLVDVENNDDNVEIVADMQEIVDETPQPPGLTVNVAGELAVGPIITDLVSPDMERILAVSFMGIIIVSFLVFFSIRYGIPPILVIFLGIAWATGIIGFAGLNFSAETSGTLSMIMGIGIDFGIQITNRFRDEVKKLIPQKAMEATMNSVFMPMFTTTLAALIGFRAMSWGQLTFFGEFGDIMTYGVVACFLVAITLVPVSLIYMEKGWARAGKSRIIMLIKRNKGVKK
ncbi:MAG: MMPL family transporter [Candidatus Aenigmatarchaeota archaeon]